MTSVLIVDDQPLLRVGLRMTLDAEDDLTVAGEASDGAEAIRLAADLKPDVILMDVRMPATDGIAATATIVASHPDSRVLILTTFDLDQYVFDGIRAGASGFLLKDTAADQLVAAIRTIARGDAILAPTATRRMLNKFVTEQAQTMPAASFITRTELIGSLTEREREVFLLMARGLSNRELAEHLFVSEHTVKIHVRHVLAKLNLRDRIQAVVLGYESGLITRAES